LSSDEEENTLCMVCCEKYATNEERDQLTECTKWAHWKCAGGDPRYVRVNCEIDVAEKWR
jgi:hypothetical protein